MTDNDETQRLPSGPRRHWTQPGPDDEYDRERAYFSEEPPSKPRYLQGQAKPPYVLEQPYTPRQYVQHSEPSYVVAMAPTSGWASASLVCGIAGVLLGICSFGIPCILAVIFGHIALRETKTGRKGGHGMAIAGLIMGYVFVVPMAILTVMGVGGSLFQ